ncbi:hypothetical protein D0Z00_003082 [Geotrichum galactomycetum]|uniref:Uncharacterized protein n=1 Tax=Geotrichum galactomycetum TaxID=27317 RepID=A0ACB6V282_9ASCO|nr:hypothetical protein D0Z00_003082 [Geotrichum candidum]
MPLWGPSSSKPPTSVDPNDSYNNDPPADWGSNEPGTVITSNSFDASSTAGPVDELANTPFPPPGLDPKKAAVQLQFLQTMTKTARKFYEADKTLTQEDRVALHKAFRFQMFSQYIGAAAGLIVGLSGPKMLCKYLKKPYKPSYSTFATLVTVLVGYSAAESYGYRRNVAKYASNQRYIDIFQSLEWYPPLIGFTYYQETIRRPESTFPDPAKFDWVKYPAFPIVLTMSHMYRVDIKGLDSKYQPPKAYTTTRTAPEQHQHQQEEEISKTGYNSSFTESQEPASSDNDSFNPRSETSGGSAWDKIRSEHTGPFTFEPQHPHPHDNKSNYSGSTLTSNSGYYNSENTHIPPVNIAPPADLETFDDPFAEKK